MSRYAKLFENPGGPGDARPTAIQVIKDEGLDVLQVFLVTGGSSGIGVETARALAITGAKVFIAVRSLEKGQVACESFLEPGRVELLSFDSSSLASVHATAAEFLKKSSTLNMLVCNAAIMMTPQRELSVDGFEIQLATNYLGHFLLFWLLQEVMQKSSTPAFNSRVVNVSSAGHHASEIRFEGLNFSTDGTYDPAKAYGQSKLAQIYMANYINRRYGHKGLHALSVMPGGISTNLQKHIPVEVKRSWVENKDIYNFMKSVEQGAATTIVAAVSKEWEGMGGKYLEDCRPASHDLLVPFTRGVEDYAYDEAKEDRLWSLTLELLGLQ
ncbi:hypothetical protein Neosp_007914 [[Neocosmospora] mangrovei]